MVASLLIGPSRAGLTMPMPIILIGVIGGTIAYGISGLFLGPIVLAVTWALLVAWTHGNGADKAEEP
jgi:predicted PurR-regulated permease PerM